MITVSSTNPINGYYLLQAMTDLGLEHDGYNTSPFGCDIILYDTAPQADIDISQALLDNYNTLGVSASATIVIEGGLDPDITCSDVQILNDTDIGYVVLLGRQVYAAGSDSVTSGTATLTLVSAPPGDYTVFIYRLTGNYASGYVQITVNEA